MPIVSENPKQVLNSRGSLEDSPRRSRSNLLIDNYNSDRNSSIGLNSESSIQGPNFNLLTTSSLWFFGSRCSVSYYISLDLEKLRIKIIESSNRYFCEWKAPEEEEIIAHIHDHIEPRLSLRNGQIVLEEESEKIFIEYTSIDREGELFIRVKKISPRERYDIMVRVNEDEEDLTFSKQFTSVELFEVFQRPVDPQLLASSISLIEGEIQIRPKVENNLIYASRHVFPESEPCILSIRHICNGPSQSLFIESDEENYLIPLLIDEYSIRKLLDLSEDLIESVDLIVPYLYIYESGPYTFIHIAKESNNPGLPEDIANTLIPPSDNSLGDEIENTNDPSMAKNTPEPSVIMKSDLSQNESFENMLERNIAGKNYVFEFNTEHSKIIVKTKDRKYTLKYTWAFPENPKEYREIMDRVVAQNDGLVFNVPGGKEIKHFKMKIKKNLSTKKEEKKEYSVDQIIYRTSIIRGDELYQIVITKEQSPSHGAVLVLQISSGEGFYQTLKIDLPTATRESNLDDLYKTLKIDPPTAARKSDPKEEYLVPICRYLSKNVLVINTQGICYMDFSTEKPKPLIKLVRVQARIRGMNARKRVAKIAWDLILKKKITKEGNKYVFLLFQKETVFFIRIVKGLEVCGVNMRADAIKNAGYRDSFEKFVLEVAVNNMKIKEDGEKFYIEGLENCSSRSY